MQGKVQDDITRKIIEDQVPNPTVPGLEIESTESPRMGWIYCHRTLPSQAPGGVTTLLPTSLTHKGHQLFNCLPRPLGNLTNSATNKFKAPLDKFVKGVSDNPPLRDAALNYIQDQLKLLRGYIWKGNSSGSPSKSSKHQGNSVVCGEVRREHAG